MINADDRDERLIQQVKTDLDRSADALDNETINRLRQIRQAALRQTEPSTIFHRGWIPAGAFASALLVGLLTVSLWFEQSPSETYAVLEDVEMLSTVDDIEFFDEFEFYQWLNTDAQAG